MRKYLYLECLSDQKDKIVEVNINTQEELNTQLALTTQEAVKSAFNLDYTEKNNAAKTQLDMTIRFRSIIQSGEYIKKLDDHLDDDTRDILKSFSQSTKVHIF